ncbi:MAG: cation:proton antiporter [Crenarchaeota archaeon]|nr:MAG: cation:proton antiporter [Thermoproteota archaeon]RDJ34287.1 MAG: cation:proton antiporter [Thermoproteota archaeon]RDJ36601.1 MAG: cation:proton antiporter [Thermoproteota archaeon]RDJ37871.1 MAG: cation:proton antiporter [Thermoproteota archaeon]
MEILEILFAVGILLVSARLLGIVFKKIKQPSLGGELLAGIILGPTLIGIVHPNEMLDLLSTVSIFFVMLFIGIEMNLREIKNSGKSGFVISILSLIIPFFTGYVLSVFFGLNLSESLFIGLLLSVTSVPVSAIILRELGILKTKIGTTVMSVAIIDDIISLIILAFILQLHLSDGMQFAYYEIGESVVQIVAYLLGIVAITFVVYKANRWLPSKLKEFNKFKSKEILFIIFISVAIVLSIIADLAGLHFIIGTFFAGLIFSEKLLPKREESKVFKTMTKITFGIFAPLFFAIVGMKFSAQSLEDHIPFLILLVILGIIGKTFGGYVGTRIFHFPKKQGLAISTLLNGRGTVGLAITALAYSVGVLDLALFSICVAICFITTIITPIIARPLLRSMN